MLETNPSCPTGNCTFPVFSSLAFCSNCIDFTQSLQHNSKCVQKPTVGWNEIIHTTNCTYELPLSNSGGLNNSYQDIWSDEPKEPNIDLSWYYRDEKTRPDIITDAPSFIIKFFDKVDRFSTGGFHLPDGQYMPSSFAALTLIKIAPQTGSASTGFLSTAHICALSVCAKRYNISMTSGLLQTETVSTS